MHEIIKSFASQFAFSPKIENASKLKHYERYIVAGMGGSHLAADLVKILKPGLDFLVHSDYDLPPIHSKDINKTLIIASSYSGNTEETITAFEEAGRQDIARAAVGVGGKLIQLAKRTGVPYIVLPNTRIQPRSALGFSTRAILALMKETRLLRESSKLAKILKPSSLEVSGKALAKRLRGFVPIVYASRQNGPIALNWKIKFNETGKVPAFWNVFPELNHNEMTSFDAAPSTKKLSKPFYFIFLEDGGDDPRLRKRMAIMKKLFTARGLTVQTIELKGKTELEKIFSSLVLADWAAYYTAHAYGLDAEEVPLVEEFKKLIR